MADETRRYYNGAAAYDVYAYQNQAARPLEEPRHLPEEYPLPQRQPRQKARTAVAPFAMAGILAVACLMVLVIFGYVQLFEATSEVSELESRLQALNEQQVMLQSKYEGRINLEQLQTRAEELGLTLPGEGQVIYVNLAGADRAEIFQQQHSSVFTEVFDALEQSVTGLIAYLNRTAA